MKALVFGGGSEVGQHILKQLSADDHQAITIAETENQAQQLKDFGAAEVFITTEDDFTNVYQGCEAIIFIAGASPVSGESKDMLVDHEAFLKAVKKAKEQGIDRFVYLSTVRSDESKESQNTGEKQQPEAVLKKEKLTYTIIHPTLSVNKPGKGTVKAALSLKDKDGEIPHEDLASLLVEALINQHTHNQTIEVTKGNTPIKEALRHLK